MKDCASRPHALAIAKFCLWMIFPRSPINKLRDLLTLLGFKQFSPSYGERFLKRC